MKRTLLAPYVGKGLTWLLGIGAVAAMVVPESSARARLRAVSDSTQLKCPFRDGLLSVPSRGF